MAKWPKSTGLDNPDAEPAWLLKTKWCGSLDSRRIAMYWDSWAVIRGNGPERLLLFFAMFLCSVFTLLFEEFLQIIDGFNDVW